MKTPKEDVDRGYAWVVLAACFAIEVLYGALICSVGVITPAILEHIDSDLVKVSWIGSTLLGTFTMCGPFIGMVEGRLGHRLASFVGGILILLGLTSASFCRTVTGLILTFGVITGLGCGLAANVSGVAPGDYFNNRLPAAYGICMSGGALGLLLVGPLTIFLLDLYTLSGTLLILGAIGFHVCSVGVLIRPSSTLKPEKSISVQPDCGDGTEECAHAPQDPAELNCVPNTDDPCAQNETTVTVFLQGDDDRHTSSQTDDNEDTDLRSPDSGIITKEDNFRGANTTVAPLLEQNSRSPNKDSWCRAIQESATLFGANGFFLYLISVLFWSLSEATCMVHLPNYAEYKGSTPAQAASLFTGMGVSALFSGMLAGFASSDKSIGNILLHVGLQGMSGISIMILPVLSHTYHLQMVACVLYGTYSQGPYTLVSPICIELIGRSKLAVAYGLWSFVLGIGLMFGPPIASLIYESSGDYDYTFIFAGCCNLASAFFAMCIPLCKRNI